MCRGLKNNTGAKKMIEGKKNSKIEAPLWNSV